MRIYFLLLCLFPSTYGFTQTAVDLDPVSIVSARSPLKLSSTGRNITVINAEQIEKLKFTSVDDILRYSGGVEVQQRGPAGSQADIVIRGGTFQQILVLLDGMKLNDPVTGHFSAYIPIIPELIDRVEILKGPAAAAYGSEAVGGVINIISKTFANKAGQKPTTLTARVEGGEYGYLAASASVFYKKDNVRFSLGAMSNNADGQLLRGANRGYFHNNTFYGAAGTALTHNWDVTLQVSYDRRDFAAQNFYTTFASDTAIEKVGSFRSHLRFSKQTDKSGNEFDLVYKNSDDNYLYNSRSIANQNNGALLMFQYLHSVNKNSFFHYNYGMLSELKSIRSNDRGSHQNGTVAGFSSAVLNKGIVTINPGIRVVYDENYGLEFLPQANIAVKIQQLILKANAGRSVRSADFTERYNNYNKALVTGGSIGNPGLSAEKSWSYEAGADLLLKNVKFSAAYFFRDQDDVIDYVPTAYSEMPRQVNLSPTGTFALAKNIAQLKTNGLELELVYSKVFSAHSSILLNANAVFLHSKSSEKTPSFYIISHAKTLLQQSVIYTLSNFSLTISSLFKERIPAKAAAIKADLKQQYWIVNTKCTYRFRTVEIFAGVNNVGNVSYADLLGSQMPGSWFTGGIAVRL